MRPKQFNTEAIATKNLEACVKAGTDFTFLVRPLPNGKFVVVILNDGEEIGFL